MGNMNFDIGQKLAPDVPQAGYPGGSVGEGVSGNPREDLGTIANMALLGLVGGVIGGVAGGLVGGPAGMTFGTAAGAMYAAGAFGAPFPGDGVD
jgi:hypothetical protein